VKKIGIVVRKGRRKIANVDEFITALSRVQWCAIHFPTLQGCTVVFERVMFGNEKESECEGTRECGTDMSSSVERDIVPLQEYAVLFGIQVSKCAVQ
jgi:hypothetical protein